MLGGAKIRRFASLRLAVLTSTGPRFWFVWTEHERTHALKDHDWNDFVKLLQWANFHGIRCGCCPSASALRVESWSTSVSWCLVRRPTDLLAQRYIYRDSNPSTCISCTDCCVAFKDFVVRRLQLQRRSSVLAKKVASRHDKQAETDLAIQFAWRRWLRHRLPSANTLAPRFASAEFAKTWYLDYLIPVESENRIFLKAPPQESLKKSLPKLAKSKTQVLEGRF